MATDVFWNDAKPPMRQGEDVAVEWLVSLARQLGITSVTEANRVEWLWRFAFAQEMRGRRPGGAKGYERDIGQLEAVLSRFMTATLEGRVADQGRDEFVEDFTRRAIDAAREQADAFSEAHADAIA